MVRHSLWTSGLSAGAAGALALALVACSEGSGGSSASPTAPSPPTQQSLGATVDGDVVDGKDRSIAHMTVEVAGTPLSTVTDSRGRFRLERVPTGDQVLLFSTPQGRAPLDVRGLRDGQRIELSVVVTNGRAQRRTAPAPGGEELSVRISPDDWNTNWDHSNGKVTVFFKGEGFDLIDPASVFLVGDDPLQPPLAPLSARVEGHHLKAQFDKSDALSLLLLPLLPGETRTMTVDFLLDGVVTQELVPVHIVGPAS